MPVQRVSQAWGWVTGLTGCAKAQSSDEIGLAKHMYMRSRAPPATRLHNFRPLNWNLQLLAQHVHEAGLQPPDHCACSLRYIGHPQYMWMVQATLAACLQRKTFPLVLPGHRNQPPSAEVHHVAGTMWRAWQQGAVLGCVKPLNVQ